MRDRDDNITRCVICGIILDEDAKDYDGLCDKHKYPKEQFDLKYRGEKVAVHCDTEEKAKAYLALEDSFGTVWGSDEKLSETRWEYYKKETCYSLFKDGKMVIGELDWYKRNGYTIVEFELDDLKPYKTPHDKFVELGLHLKITKNWAGGVFSHEWWNDNNDRVVVFFVDEKVTTVYEASNEIMRIIPEYLEWLEEEK